jgi:hypothetical protein
VFTEQELHMRGVMAEVDMSFVHVSGKFKEYL